MELSRDKVCVQKHSSIICYITLKVVCYLFPYMCLGVSPNQEITKVQSKLLQRCITTAKRTFFFNNFLPCNLQTSDIFCLKMWETKNCKSVILNFCSLIFQIRFKWENLSCGKIDHRYLQILTCKILFMLLYEFPQ